jgi:hypothetical protein
MVGDIERVKISDHLSEQLFHDYTYLGNLSSWPSEFAQRITGSACV